MRGERSPDLRLRVISCSVRAGRGIGADRRGTHLFQHLGIDQPGHQRMDAQIALFDDLLEIGHHRGRQPLIGGNHVEQPIDGAAGPILGLQADGKDPGLDLLASLRVRRASSRFPSQSTKASRSHGPRDSVQGRATATA